MEDIIYLFADLNMTVQHFYRKNADLDASGIIQLEPVMHKCKKLELYLSGDFKTLWQIEKAEAANLREVISDQGSAEEVEYLTRELLIMKRCAKRMSDNYQKECAEHERTRLYGSPGEIDGAAAPGCQYSPSCLSPSFSASSRTARTPRRMTF